MSTPDPYNPVEQLPWQDDALCAQTGAEQFFIEQGISAQPAKRVCAACPVTAECLQYAQDQMILFGIFGGLTAQQRARIRKKQRAETAA